MDAGGPSQHDRKGLAAAFGAYIIWGFLPLYLILVQTVPAFEFVGWRIIWTLPLCLLIALFRKQGANCARHLVIAARSAGSPSARR
jgi:chloramphenicol-sensitive protein RarD